jgi:uncharacterized membrane protein
MTSKGRLEAFSDGVIAIAITLLVLDLRVPAPGGAALSQKLGHEWPSYVAYGVSFITIGIIWINHHAMVARLRHVDHSVLILNLLLLLTIGLLPFTTALLAEYLRESNGQRLAAAVYGGSFLLMAIAFVVMQSHLLDRRRHLLQGALSREERELIKRRGRVGVVPYVVATALAAVSSYITLAICGAVAFYYALPIASQPGGPPGD